MTKGQFEKAVKNITNGKKDVPIQVYTVGRKLDGVLEDIGSGLALLTNSTGRAVVDIAGVSSITSVAG